MQQKASKVEAIIADLHKKGFNNTFYIDYLGTIARTEGQTFRPYELEVVSKNKVSDFPESDDFTRVYALSANNGTKGVLQVHTTHPFYKKIKKFAKECKQKKFRSAPYPYHI